MKKTLLISGLLLALTASVASAGGINLNWAACSAGPALQDVAFACNTNTGVAGQLFATFDPNNTQNTAAFEFVIDLQSAGAQFPLWWQVKQPGTCRQASMTMNTNYAGGPFDCADPWAGTIGLQDFAMILGAHGPNTARISGGGAVPATAPVATEAGIEYYGVTLTLNRAKTTGLGACAGCLDPVCLVFNNMLLFNEVGAEQHVNAPRDRNYVTWQGGAVGGAGCPAATPTSKATWGKIKSIYR